MSEDNRYGIAGVTKEDVDVLSKELEGVINQIPSIKKINKKYRFVRCLIAILKDDAGWTKESIIFRIHVLSGLPEETVRKIFESYVVTI